VFISCSFVNFYLMAANTDVCVGNINKQQSASHSQITRYVVMPSLMAAPWLGQNSGSVFRCLWTKVHRAKFACAGVSGVCNAVFQLTMSCCIPEIFAIKSRSCAKLRRSFDVFGATNFGGNGPPKFQTEFYKSGSPSNMWQSLATMGQRPRRLGGEKRCKLQR